MSFDRLGLTPELVRAVEQQGYTEPTPVQRESIPLILEGRDLLAGAQTGTGKTAAFVLPILQRLNQSADAGSINRRRVRALVLTPTRELCLQVEESVRTYGVQRPVSSTAIYGGVDYDKQVRRLLQGAQLVVATPGRLLDHVRQRTIDLSGVEVLVLDEADRMLDMGFIPDVRRIIDLLPRQRQTLLFSATISEQVRRLAADFQREPSVVEVTPRNSAPDLVHQLVMPVERLRKRELLLELIRSGRINQAIVFTRTKHGASRLAQQLERDGLAATAIHGDKSQPQRQRALNEFKEGKVTILVATDVAARGLDIDALPHVINFELPTVAEDYLHRVGRTGRAGADGHAIAFVAPDELQLLTAIERLLGRQIEVELMPGFASEAPRRQSIERGRPNAAAGVSGQRSDSGRPRRGRSGGRSAPQRPTPTRPTAGPSRPARSASPTNAPFTTMPGERFARR
ncbi:MAG TPA: DEAD/DEAH box helicase [Candidatus Limnocylindrales bacterium]|nr:DEAD/DEAH box helicase [Candidatus Limnocylindrales bacterium]